MSFLQNLLRSKYLKTCSAYSIAMGSSVAIKMSLVLLMATVFGLTDSTKFAVYTGFALAADFAAIVGSYISQHFLRSRTSLLFAFIMAICSSGLIVNTVLQNNLSLFYLGLAILAVSFGIIRCNLMIISNDYLKIEFKEHQNEYGSLLHSLTTLMSFGIVFIAGSTIKSSIIYTVLIPALLIIVSFLVFFFNQRNYIAQELVELKEKIKTGRYKLYKMAMFFTLILFSVAGAFSFIYFNKFDIVKNVPLLIIGIFYAYLFHRAYKNPSERKSIFLAASMALIVIFFLGLERQRDMSIALFLQRNVVLEIFGYTLTPLQINAMYQLSTIFLSFAFLKYKIHSKLNHTKVILIVLFLSMASFLSLYGSCALASQDGLANINLYLLTMTLMAAGTVLVVTKFIEICRLMPESLKNIISSFMIMNMGIAFYLAKIYANFIAIDQTNFDRLYSLSVYKEGFLKIFIISAIFSFTVFFIISFTKSKNLFKTEEKLILSTNNNAAAKTN